MQIFTQIIYLLYNTQVTEIYVWLIKTIQLNITVFILGTSIKYVKVHISLSSLTSMKLMQFRVNIYLSTTNFIKWTFTVINVAC